MGNLDAIGVAASTVVAVDRDKNSQHAVRWAIENLRLKEKIIILLHVATNQQNLHPQDSERISSYSEMQQLFLPYRGICARKGVRTKEVILHDLDIAVALSNFLRTHSIKNIVLGATSRGAIARAFRNGDVATSVGKLAPDFCSVYAISRAKAHRIKSSSDTVTPAPPHVSSKLHREGSLGNISKREYQRSTSPSEGSIASSAPSPAYSTTSSNDSRRLFVWETPNRNSNQTPPESRNISYESNRASLDNPMAGNSQFKYVSTPPNRPPDSRAHRLAIEGSPNHYSLRSSNQSEQHSYPSDISYEILDEPRTSDLAAELEDELKRVKLELKQITDKYNAACQEATTTREREKGKVIIHRRSNASTAEELALAIVEDEKHNSKAAMEIVHKAQMLADMESEKRKEAEMKLTIESEQKQPVLDTLAQNLAAQCRRYTIDEIESATNNFKMDKIGEGSYGPVYKANIDHTTVAIKVLKSDLPDGLKQFQQEVEVLSRMRHPNMVILLGACPEYGCLVYEYMDNGSLEDRLFCKDGSPPLPWAVRFSIAAQIATGLNFLHQTRPQPLVHRDLKPANILLDRNHVTKISDVGVSRLVPPAAGDDDEDMGQYRMTAAAGTFCYIDPEYQQTGLLGTKSDVYSLGIILLQMVTARPPMGLTHLVETAMEAGRFGEIVDERGGEWPEEEVMAMAKLGLRCSELRRRDRPSLGAVVLPELMRLRDVAMEKEKEKEEGRGRRRREYYFTYAGDFEES